MAEILLRFPSDHSGDERSLVIPKSGRRATGRQGTARLVYPKRPLPASGPVRGTSDALALCIGAKS